MKCSLFTMLKAFLKSIQQAHLGPLVLRQSVSKRVSDNLHAPLATYAIVFAIESLTDRLFAPKTEALRNQAPNRISARERPNRGLTFQEQWRRHLPSTASETQDPCHAQSSCRRV